MNILIPDSWLREYLTTNANPRELANALSLCGPTVDRIHKSGKDSVYDIEVTTNRVDAMSVYGIAREANAILPRFGFNAKLKKPDLKKITNKSDLGLEIVNDPKLCHRILAVKLENVNLGPSPKWLADKLLKVEQRPLLNAIDITNYVMWELGHPIHAFDYDQIKTKKIIVRDASKGEKFVTLDNKTHILRGGEVVFDSGEKEIIDLPGIMGTKNTVVTSKTKNVLLWIESVDHVRIRKASMGLNIRSQAAILNEKHVDTNLGLPAMLRAIEIYQKVTGADVASKLVDIYPNKPKINKIKVKREFINTRLGIEVSKTDIKNYLSALEIKSSWRGNLLTVDVPTFRSHDMSIPEDIVEEVARIYGYHNLPNNIMATSIPERSTDNIFEFESKLRDILKNSGGYEVYTTSTVSEEYVTGNALKIKNPLGSDSEYLRTTLLHSIKDAALVNKTAEPFFLYEIGSIYLERKNKLPEEIMMIGGVFSGYSYRASKGIVSHLLNMLNIEHRFESKERKYFSAGKRLVVYSGKKKIGQFGILEDENLVYFDFSVESLQGLTKQIMYTPPAKYPPQIEDITFKLPHKTKVMEVIQSIKQSSKLITKSELMDIYKDYYTFRVYYQHPEKTLKDVEVEKVRKSTIKLVTKQFGASVK